MLLAKQKATLESHSSLTEARRSMIQQSAYSIVISTHIKKPRTSARADTHIRVAKMILGKPRTMQRTSRRRTKVAKVYVGRGEGNKGRDAYQRMLVLCISIRINSN